jgi:hypothetical protein
MTLKRLVEKRPFLTKVGMAAHHKSRWLQGPAVLLSLSQQLWIMNQTGAAMGSQCSCTDQHSIRPSQSLLKHPPITGTA